MKLFQLFFRRLKHFCENPSRMITKLMLRHCPRLVSDRQQIQYMWNERMDYPLDLNNPKTFCEKLQWLKMHDHNPLYHTMVDKYEVKKIVAERVGQEYVPKTYGIFNSINEIDFNTLPDKFVLKCTHNSGSFVICHEKSALNQEKVKSALADGMACKDYYLGSREWAYKSVKPRIIAEELLEDNTFDDLVNYKFLCFNGEPQLMYITVKSGDIWENYYDMDFQPLDISHGFRKYEEVIEKPKTFEQMKNIARKLSLGIPHVRVDLYQIKGHIKFSEFTFYDWAGFKPIRPIAWDYQIGSWLDTSII